MSSGIELAITIGAILSAVLILAGAGFWISGLLQAKRAAEEEEAKAKQAHQYSISAVEIIEQAREQAKAAESKDLDQLMAENQELLKRLRGEKPGRNGK